VKVNELFERLPLPVKARLPAFAGATGWLTTKPLTPADLQGKVVLVDFWTYTCNQLDPDASALSLARVMGPPCCHDLGTTLGRHRPVGGDD
jgi:hypothetical protein